MWTVDPAAESYSVLIITRWNEVNFGVGSLFWMRLHCFPGAHIFHIDYSKCFLTLIN